MNLTERLDLLIEKINRLPACAGSDVEVTWGAPSTVEALDAIEAALGVELPRSFRLFQMKTGGGGIDGLSMSTVPPSGPVSAGTLYSDTTSYRERAHRPLPGHLVVIERDPDDNEPFCLDTSGMQDGECPVVLYYHQSTGHIERIAANFLDFYERYASPYFDDAGI